MPLQNRVDPYGVLFRTPARGTIMGNRGGALHNDAREIVRSWKTRRWIACVLEFKGIRRAVMSPRRYTELFFLDEAVAFAAGHRPCAECRRERFNAFKAAWSGRPVLADAIDLELHRHRVEHLTQVPHRAPLESLPDGTFVEIDHSPWLVWNNALLLWTPESYTQRRPRPAHATVTVLTPRPIVECFRRGYAPQIHTSADVYRELDRSLGLRL
ncbi:MAG TPA: hypothetical protein VKB88_36050 [Bryobacteraceae bacterium]|nr:hypothetical protein [Bryobacteraceae bacterium]